jgi:hypothetical protein
MFRTNGQQTQDTNILCAIHVSLGIIVFDIMKQNRRNITVLLRYKCISGTF